MRSPPPVRHNGGSDINWPKEWTNTEDNKEAAAQAMIDLHCHILPGIDDGAADIAVSLEMARMFVADGVSVVAATPHILPGLYANTGQQIRAAIRSLQAILDDGRNTAATGERRRQSHRAELRVGVALRSSACRSPIAATSWSSRRITSLPRAWRSYSSIFRLRASSRSSPTPSG